MPIYGYACTQCGHTLDALQKMSDAPLVECPECGKPALKRQLSAPRFRLAGKGWYETDFKSGNQRNIAGEKEASRPDGKDGEKKPEKSGDKAADKKPADKKAGSKASTGDSSKPA